jgi:ribosomal-protein-alanine N-acetyltransferase
VVDNNFWIYGIINKSDNQFIGTVAVVKDPNNDDEIGYHFLENYWSLGYGFEICKGLISDCQKIGMKKIIAYVVGENKASVKIVENNNFKILKRFISDDLQVMIFNYQKRNTN